MPSKWYVAIICTYFCWLFLFSHISFCLSFYVYVAYLRAEPVPEELMFEHLTATGGNHFLRSLLLALVPSTRN